MDESQLEFLSAQPPGGSPAPRTAPGQAPFARTAEPTRLAALLELLRDDSPSVLATVCARIEEFGERARLPLARAARSGDARLRGRARALVAALDRRRAARRLIGRACQPRPGLEGSLWLLSGYGQPGFDARPYQLALDAMAAAVRERAARQPEPLQAALELAQYLGGELGFRGDRGDYHHPDNILLHRAIERRAGLPLTLTLLYVLVGRRAGIRCAAVPLPGHVVLRLYADQRSLLLDPFDGGRPRSRRDCEEFLRQHGLSPDPSWFQDADASLVLQRQTMNLARSYQTRGLERESRELYGLVQAMTKLRETRVAARLEHRGGA